MAQYRALTGLDFQGGKGGNKSRANNKAGAPPSEGGVVAHADGSRTVLTYGTDASGKRIPVTTEYDREGRIVAKTTVDSKGQVVPAK
jgi:YD repeat-containing protein